MLPILHSVDSKNTIG
jgi:hypothetical protein